MSNSNNACWNIYSSHSAGEGATSSEEARRSRFEEGQPADPTKNMNPADAKEWKKQNEENKDNFKSATEEGSEGPLDRYRLELDTAIETLKVLKKKKPQTAKRHLFILLESLGKAIAQLEEGGKGPLSEVFFNAATKMNAQWSASDFANYKK
jgi:hypothetical protein